MKISIIGAAGTIGSCAAFNIAVSGLADEIVMIDTEKNMLRHHAMDLRTATLKYNVKILAGGDDDISDSDIIIISASAPHIGIQSRLDLLPDNLPIIMDIAKKISMYSPRSKIITVSVPVGPLNYAIYRSTGIDRRQLLGYTVNDSFRFREMLADALGVNYNQVEGVVMGEHGDSQVPLFSSVRVDGKPVSVSEEIKKGICERARNSLRSFNVLKVGRSSGWASAVGLTDMVRAIAGNTGEMIPCSLVLEGEYGYNGLSMTVPATIGRDGFSEILQWQLTTDEKKELDHSAGILKGAVDTVERYIGSGLS